MEFSTAAIALLLATTPVSGNCFPRDQLVHVLTGYGESPVGMGLSNGVVFELFTTANGETWTMAVSSPDGMSCVVAVGESWIHRPSVQDAAQ